VTLATLLTGPPPRSCALSLVLLNADKLIRPTMTPTRTATTIAVRILMFTLRSPNWRRLAGAPRTLLFMMVSF
jgi:hypothetical protein